MQNTYIPLYGNQSKSFSSVATNSSNTISHVALGRELLQTDVSKRLKSIHPIENKIERNSPDSHCINLKGSNKSINNQQIQKSPSQNLQIFESILPQLNNQAIEIKVQKKSMMVQKSTEEIASELSLTKSGKWSRSPNINKIVRKSENHAYGGASNNFNPQYTTNVFTENSDKYIYENEVGNYYRSPVEKPKIVEVKNDNRLLNRQKLEDSISEMKAKFIELKTFSCNCNFFRLTMESDIIRMFKCPNFVKQIKCPVKRSPPQRLQ